MLNGQDDRAIAALQTEQSNPATKGISALPTFELLQRINDMDQMVAPAVRAALPQVEAAVELVVQKMKAGGRLIYVGAGTSGRLGFMDAAECAPTYGTDRVCCVMAGGRNAVFSARETFEDECRLAVDDLKAMEVTKDDAVFAVAASGRTPYCIAALDYAAEVGAARIALSCNRDAVMSRHAQVGIEVDTGPEFIMGSTRMKAGTAQKLVMNTVSTAVMIRLGRTWDNLMIKLNAKNQKGHNRMERIFLEAVGATDVEYAQKALARADGSLEIAVLMELARARSDKAHEALEVCGGHFQNAMDLLRNEGGEIGNC